MLTKVACDPHPDRLQVLQRMKVRLICSDADFIVPVDRPCVEAEGIDEFVGVDPLMDELEDDPLPALQELHVPPDAVVEEEIIAEE